MPLRSSIITASPQVRSHRQAVPQLDKSGGPKRQHPPRHGLARPIRRQPRLWIDIGLVVAVIAAAIPTPKSQLQMPQSSAAIVQAAVSPGAIRTAPNQSIQGIGLPPSSTDDASLKTLFAGGTNSLVARSVGHAEGTRTAGGQRTAAYYGHVDPGNSAWNLGSFSYQHHARSPEDADRQQLQRLESQAVTLRQQAAALGVPFGLQEELNGIDLANQAPLAALGENGYISRLAQAYERQLRGADAIVWARTWAYVDPATRQLDAPGLGNRVWRVRADQSRRHQAINDAIKNSMGDRDELLLANQD